jgi:arylamine N-acetyltransferase
MQRTKLGVTDMRLEKRLRPLDRTFGSNECKHTIRKRLDVPPLTARAMSDGRLRAEANGAETERECQVKDAPVSTCLSQMLANARKTARFEFQSERTESRVKSDLK